MEREIQFLNRESDLLIRGLCLKIHHSFVMIIVDLPASRERKVRSKSLFQQPMALDLDLYPCTQYRKSCPSGEEGTLKLSTFCSRQVRIYCRIQD